MRRLFSPVDIAPLVWLRLVFGGTMLWELWRVWHYGWIRAYWIAPTFHFKYHGFGSVEALPGNGMYYLFAMLALLALLTLVGCFYRISMVLFCVGYGYLFLIEQARFQNHFYLLCLLALLLACVPAHRALSVDVWRNPVLRASHAPAWTLWLLRAQIGIVYFYGGIAKLNGDWLGRAEPMRTFLRRRIDDPLVALIHDKEWVVYGMSYAGLLLDLAIEPLLMWRRTRWLAVVALVSFHLLNSRIFSIGVFPWFMLAVTPIFFEPGWLRSVLRRPPGEPGRMGRLSRPTVALLAAYLLVQLVVPLRHFIQPGNVLWIEDGRLFSWHMKLHAKQAEGYFELTDPERGLTTRVDPRRLLPDWQVVRLLATPDMILQFSHRLAREARDQGIERIEVRAFITASLHGRPPQYLVDPTVDLAAERRPLWPARWIVPLERGD